MEQGLCRGSDVHLFHIMHLSSGDFKDGCEKRAVSLHHILCISQTYYNRNSYKGSQVFGEQSLG